MANFDFKKYLIVFLYIFGTGFAIGMLDIILVPFFGRRDDLLGAILLMAWPTILGLLTFAILLVISVWDRGARKHLLIVGAAALLLILANKWENSIMNNCDRLQMQKAELGQQNLREGICAYFYPDNNAFLQDAIKKKAANLKK